MINLLKQGKVSKWFAGIGQEAVSIGACLALEEDEYILPLHRNLGIFTARNIPLNRLFAQFQGKLSGFTKGRDRSFHFGTKQHHIIGMISHLGAQLAVADGIALAKKLKKEDKVSLVFCGDGGSSEGDFHEALNVAAVWDLPVIFLVENNQYSISTPVEEQYKIKSFKEKGPAYGIETVEIEGNNILEVYQTVKKLATSIRKNNRPVMIEAKTFRMRGHEESANNDFVPEQLFEEWAKKDPIYNYEQYLKAEGIIDHDSIENLYGQTEDDIEDAIKIANEEEEIHSTPEAEAEDLYQPFEFNTRIHSHSGTELRYIDAIRETLDENLKLHNNLILMGQDIAEFGGVFKATQGLVEKYGKDRVRNTPLCESAILGAGLGLAIDGYKSVIEMQFGDFVSCGFNQVVNNLAKAHYRWGQNADVVIRLPSGAGTGAGPYHSQTNEAWFYRVPGLKIVYPSTPFDVKGLLNAAIEDPNPYLFFEHKALYRSVKENVPAEHYIIEPGKGKLISSGEDLTVITYGQPVHWVKNLLKDLDENSIDLIDLRSIVPWDQEMVSRSIKKTGRALLITEDNLTGSILGDISAWIMENLFDHLDAPVQRIGSLDTPIPFAKNLEDNYLPKNRIKDAIETMLEY